DDGSRARSDSKQYVGMLPFFFSSRRRHTRFSRDWSSDVCSSDLALGSYMRKLEPDLVFESDGGLYVFDVKYKAFDPQFGVKREEIGRASCRERLWISVVAGSSKRKRVLRAEDLAESA